MPRLIIAAAILACLAGPSVSEEKTAPAGLVCPAALAGGELISVATAAPEPGVTGYCVYYLVGETDFEAVTMTLRAADATYDWKASFKAPKIAKGGMTPVADTVEVVPFGGGEKPATLISLSVAEKDLGPITESFSTLWVFDLGDGRFVSLEEEYSNVSEAMRGALREALLKAQQG
jgi:hypothetical protein